MNWLRRLFGSTSGPAKGSATASEPRSKFEGAQTNDADYYHWMNADGLGPNASASPDVRKILRDRARFERDNDPHLNGLTRSLSQDLIGSGPRLQLNAPDAPLTDVRFVEKSFARWARETGWGPKLRVMAEAKPVDGETFALLASNARFRHPVKLDLRPFECDLVTDPWTRSPEDAGDWDDGIEFDAGGYPTRFTILRSYPGDPYEYGRSSEYDLVESPNVLHWFRAYRPGQRRGVTDFASVLAVIGQLRRYSQAVLSNAEHAASIAGVIYSDGAAEPEDEEMAVTPKPMDKVFVPHNKLLTMPYGWKAESFKGDQPTSTYKDYAADKRNEIARPTGAPFNVMSGNSSGYNYSSGRLDHVPYHRNIWAERESMREPVLDRVATAWLREFAALGLLPASLGPVADLDVEWQWDGFNSIDPYKDAQASDLRLRIGLTTLAEECAAEGRNWRDVLEQQKVEQDLRTELGLTPVAPPAPAAGNNAPAAALEDDEDETDDTALERRGARRVPA